MSEVERLYAADLAYSQLTADINDSVTSMTVETGANFPQTPFLVIVGNEIIKVNDYDEMTGVMSQLNRGYSYSIAASHSGGDRVALAIIADYINNVYDYVDALEDDIVENTGKIGVLEGKVDEIEEITDELGDDYVRKDGDTLEGDLDFDWNTGDKVNLKQFRETVPSPSSGSGTVTINVANGTVFKHSMTGNTTFAFTAPGTSGPCFSFTLIVKMDSSLRTITWPSSVRWQEGETPERPPVNRVSIYTFMTINNGSRWYGFQAGNNIAE